MELLERQHTQVILNSIADGVFTVDDSRRITSFNRAAEEITGVKQEQAAGRYCWEVFHASICEQQCALLKTMETGNPIINEAVYIINSQGERVPISISTSLLKDKNGKTIGAVETFRDLSVVEALRKELADKHSFMDIISKNQEMQRLFGMLELVSENDSTVLIEGESGTGKELFAKAIHSLSHRRNGPLITINCGAMPDTLLESELFGYKAGAFTDAKKDKPGRLAQAEKGTLFLDEIGDISQMLQVRLLRVLQDRVYEPLGGTRSVKADVRIVAATNKNLEALVAQGSFRKDLYYRIHVVKLSLPPLRSRKEDIPLLTNHVINKYNRLQGREIQGVATHAMARLMAHNFPGNVRELENIIEYASVVCRTPRIGLENLPDYLRPENSKGLISSQFNENGRPTKLEYIEKSFLLETLKNNNWHRATTARQLGMHPTTLWRKMARLNIKAPGQDGRHKLKTK